MLTTCTCYITTCRSSPLSAWSLAGLLTLCRGVTIHMSWWLFTMSFFRHLVARLANIFIYFLYVCSLLSDVQFVLSVMCFTTYCYVCDQACIVRVWYAVFFQQTVLWGRHPWLLGLYRNWCKALYSYMRYICMRLFGSVACLPGWGYFSVAALFRLAQVADHV